MQDQVRNLHLWFDEWSLSIVSICISARKISDDVNMTSLSVRGPVYCSVSFVVFRIVRSAIWYPVWSTIDIIHIPCDISSRSNVWYPSWDEYIILILDCSNKWRENIIINLNRISIFFSQFFLNTIRIGYDQFRQKNDEILLIYDNSSMTVLIYFSPCGPTSLTSDSISYDFWESRSRYARSWLDSLMTRFHEIFDDILQSTLDVYRRRYLKISSDKNVCL